MLALLVAGCAGRTIAYPLGAVDARPDPLHRVRVAVVPFSDARSEEEGPDDAEAFSYDGVELGHTDLSELSGPATDAITELVARHLAKAHVFAQLILVQDSEDAPEADLVMSARLRRARGYVEANPRKASRGRPLDERTVLAEVLIADLELRDPTGRVLFRSDFGWSILQERKIAGAAPDPWMVLTEALFVTNEQLVRALADADLSGGSRVLDRVELPRVTRTSTGGDPFGALEGDLPEGWSFTRTASAARPVGWKGGPAACREAQIAQLHTQRFHRVLGPYRPRLRLWACGPEVPLRFDALVEFPAKFMGTRADGLRYFSLMLGQSNWPHAGEQVAQRLQVTPPAERHVFELGPGP